MKGDRDSKNEWNKKVDVVNDLCVPVPTLFLTQKGHRDMNVHGDGDTFTITALGMQLLVLLTFAELILPSLPPYFMK